MGLDRGKYLHITGPGVCVRVISWRDQNLGNVGHFWTQVRTVCLFGKRRDNRREADGDQIAEVRERQDRLSFLVFKTAGLSH